MILPDVISEEPLTPLVPHGDSQWFDIVKATMSILIYAEAYGINSTNVEAMTLSENVKVKRLLGVEGAWGARRIGTGPDSGPDCRWFLGKLRRDLDRNVGSGGIGLRREDSRNALWADAPMHRLS